MSTTSNLQNSLFEAMKIFSDYSVSNSDATLTIEGQIHEVLDEGAGQYSVEYLGNTLTAHSANNATYAVGDNVYILIPEGDFGKEKIILGTISASTDLYITDLNDLGYNEISDNLITNADIADAIIQMSSYTTTEETDYDIISDSDNKNLFGKLFESYLVDYNIFKFSYSVKTSFAVSQQAGGNYGVSLHIPLIAASEDGGGSTSQIWKAVTLDVGNIIGDPYRLTAWSPQSVYFAIDSQYTYDTSRIPYISYFCYGFPQDSTKANIFDVLIKDISFNVADELTEDETTGYSLSLKASQGEYFSTFYDTTKTITPTLKVNGKTTSISKASIYWFRENAEIKADSTSYLAYGGYGWECLNDKTNIAAAEDGSVTFDYITNATTLKVSEKDVLSTTRYKCVVIYKEKTVSAIIKLKNLVSNSYLKLAGTNGTNVFLKDTGFVNLTAIVYYEGITDHVDAENYRDYIKLSWLRYDKNGTYLNDQGTIFKTVTYNAIEDGCFVTQVKYPVSLVEDSNIVYCSAKYIRVETDANGNAVIIEHLIGTEEIPVLTTIEDGFNLVINGDDVIYKYDSDGDSPIGTAYDGPSTSKVTSITSLTYTLRKKDGIELTEDEYACAKYTWKITKNGMFVISGATSSDDDYYYVTGYGNNGALPYSIANRYNISKAKNSSITLTVEFQDSIITSSASINFIKEGMGGSNGTAYAAELVWGGTTAAASVPYGTLTADGFAKKLKFWYNINNKVLYYYDFEKKTLVKWSESPRYIYARVWENSSELDYSASAATENAYTIEWSMFDSGVTNPCFEISSAYKKNRNARISLIENSLTSSTIGDIFCNIVQAKITVNGQSSVANQNEIIYVYYPIEITLTNFDSDIIPSLDGGFAEVMYASDGTNPAWDETNEFVINDNQFIDDEFADFFDVTWSASNHLKIKEGSSSNSKIIKPDNKFDDGDSQNYVKTTLDFKSNKTNIEALKEDAETLKASCEDSIAKIENTEKVLKSFVKSWTYDAWSEKLNNVKSFLDKRTSATYYATVLSTDSLNALNEYLSIQKNQNGINIDYYCGQTLQEIENLQTAVSNAIQQLQKMESINTLVSLASYKISWSSDLKNIITQGIGSNFAITLKALIDDVNKQITNYENSLSVLKKLTGISTYIKNYVSLINNISNVCNILSNAEDILSRYSQIGTKCSLYLKNVYSVVSYKDISKIFDDIYTNLLSSIFDKSNGVLVLNDSTLNEFSETKSKCEKEIAEIEKTIDFYERLLTYISNKGNNPTIIHIRPIVLYFNRYEMSNINAWDGNKIETGDGSYLLAPQVGAGIKESDNSFTGMVMGQRNITSSSSAGRNGQVGLFGYSKGEQTLLLNADNGSAVFGKSGSGQIVVDPEGKGYLYSSSYFKNYNNQTGLPTNYNNSNLNGKGMLIDLNTPEIKFGSGNFSVNSSGELTAKGGGSIASWQIGDTTLKSKNSAITLDSSNEAIIFGTAAGKIYSGNHTSYTSTGNGFYLDYQGLSIGSKFKASKDGVLELGNLSGNHWTISGDSSKSYINYGTSGQNNSVYIGTDQITLGAKFKIDNNGNMSGGSTNSWSINSAGTATFNNLVANNTGTIGGWIIGSNYLKSSNGNLTLNNNGSITGTNWNITSTGVANFSNVTTFASTTNFTSSASFKNSSGSNVAAFSTNGFSVYTGSLGNSNNSVSSSKGLTVGSGSVGGNSVSKNSLGLGTSNFTIDDENPVTYIKNLAVDALDVSGSLSFQGRSCKWQSVNVVKKIGVKWTYTTIEDTQVITDITDVYAVGRTYWMLVSDQSGVDVNWT